MLLSRTTILGLLACLSSRTTSRPLEVDSHAVTVNSSSVAIDSHPVQVDSRSVKIKPRKPPPPPPREEYDLIYEEGDEVSGHVNIYDATKDGEYSEDEWTEGVLVNDDQARRIPSLHCTYSYNALYDWYVISGQGWYPNDDAAMDEIKKCAKGAGLMTGWRENNESHDGRIAVEVSIRRSYLPRIMTDSECVQFRLPLGKRSSLLKRLGTQMFPPHGKRVGCIRVSRQSQNLFSDTTYP